MVKPERKPSRKGIQKPSSCREPIQCPHVHFRHDVPDRRGISREKLINILATPKGYCWEDVKREEDGKEKPSARKTPTQPKRAHCKKYGRKYDKAYIHNFLAEVWAFLCPQMADQLKTMLMNEFSMTEKDANDFIFKQREVNILNSSTVSLYKKPRYIGDGKTVLDSVIKLRTPNKTYCDKFPMSTIGIRNSWIKDISGIISEKMADYVLDTMTADRTERQQEIAQTLLNRFNTMLEQKASLSKPRTQTHKTMALVADRVSLWLDKNVPMSKENSERLKDIEEAEEEKKKGGDWKKRLEEKKNRREGKKLPPKSKGKKELEDGGITGQPTVEDELFEEEGGRGEPEISGGGEGDSEMGDESELEHEEGGGSEWEDEDEGDESELEDSRPTDPAPEGIGDEGREDGGQLKPDGEDGGQLVPEGEDGAQSVKDDGQQPSGDERAQGYEEGAPPPEGVPEPPESRDGVESGEDGGVLPPPGSSTEDGGTQGGEGTQSVEDGPSKDEGEQGEDVMLKSAADDGMETTPPDTEPTLSMEVAVTEGKEEADDGPKETEVVPSGASEFEDESEHEDGQLSSAEQQLTTEDEDESKKQGEFVPTEAGGGEVDEVAKQEGGDEPGKDNSATSASAPQQEPSGPVVDDGSESRPEDTITAEESRQKELIQSIASLIADTPIAETSRQEALKDVLSKQLEKEVGDEDTSTTSRVASKVATWIDKIVDRVETEYGDRNVKPLDRMGSVPQASSVSVGKLPPVSQKPKGRIFVVKKVDDRQGYDVDLMSNTRAQEKIRLARGKLLPHVEVPNPDAALEPADVKKWVEWASTVSATAQSWAEWIEDTVQEAQKRGEMLQTDDSPEKRKEWDVFRGNKAQGAQQWRKTKKELDRSAELWDQKGMKTRELKKPAQL